MQQIAFKHGIEYWDFYDSEMFSFDDYHDMEHLNREGALKFSLMLNDSINKMESKLKTQHLANKQ